MKYYVLLIHMSCCAFTLCVLCDAFCVMCLYINSYVCAYALCLSYVIYGLHLEYITHKSFMPSYLMS